MEPLKIWKQAPFAYGKHVETTSEYEPCRVSTSERSELTAPKKLLDIYGLGISDKEALTANFLSRLSAESVNNADLPMRNPLNRPAFGFREVPVDRLSNLWPAASLDEWASINEDAEAAVGQEGASVREDESTDNDDTPSSTAKKQLTEHSNSDASELGLVMLAAASARFQAYDSMAELFRASWGLPGGRKIQKQSLSQIRQKERQRKKRFESSSFCLSPNIKKKRR